MLFLTEINAEMREKFWYALYTKPRHEKRVTEELTKSGYTVYLPLIRTLRQWSDRKKKVEMPLISSYVFVNVNLKEYYEVLSVCGAVRYVSFEGKAAEIRDSQITALKKAVEGNMQIEVMQKCFEKGQKVRIISGVMRGCEGEFVGKRGRSSFIINLDNVGFVVKVKISADDVIRI